MIRLKKAPLRKVLVPVPRETREYLDFSDTDMSFDGVYNDLSDDAVAPVFRELQQENLSDADILSRISVILSPNKSFGLKFITYMENYKKIVAEDAELLDEAINPAGAAWADSDVRIPIVPYGEVQAASVLTPPPFNPLGGGFGSEEPALCGDVGTLYQSKYWTGQSTGPIIIQIHQMAIQWYEISADVLSMFPKNSRIYFLVTGSTITEQEEFSIPSELTAFCIETDATLLRIYSDKEHVRAYYKKIFLEAVSERNMQIMTEFPVDEFIDAVLATQSDYHDSLLLKIIDRHKNRIGNTINDETYKLVGKLANNKEEKSAKEKMDEFYGLNGVKAKLQQIVHSFAYSAQREKLGLSTMPPRVILFVGPPGTAKSQMAEVLAQALAEQKLLPNGKVQSMNAAQLQGEYLGQTPHRVASVFNDFIDGSATVFLDEIYSIAMDHESNIYANEALSQLCIELEKVALGKSPTKLVVLAGYGGSSADGSQNFTKKFLEANPGIASRISTIVEFPAAGASEAVEIFGQIVRNHGYSMTEEEKIKEMLRSYFSTRIQQKDWGSGREARQLFTGAISAVSDRLAQCNGFNQIPEEELSLLRTEDVAAAIEEAKAMHRSQRGKQTKLGYN